MPKDHLPVMYYAIVGLLMLLLPAFSAVVELLLAPQPVIPVIGKWYVFWAIGARLFLAGLRQIIQPRYTAQTILGLKSDESLVVVRELGFGNLALGVTGLLSIHSSTWCVPVALAGGIFYGLAGGNHALQSHRGKLENVAMASDIFAATVLLSFCFVTLGS